MRLRSADILAKRLCKTCQQRSKNCASRRFLAKFVIDDEKISNKQRLLITFIQNQIANLLHFTTNRTQCCQRLATAATFLRKKLCCPGAMTRRWAPQTRYTLRRITASIIKDLIDLNKMQLLTLSFLNDFFHRVAKESCKKLFSFKS